MNLRKAAQQALEALEVADTWGTWHRGSQAITDLRDALADTQDWSELEALRKSLREHMAEVHRLRAAVRQALGALQFCLPLIEDNGDEEQLAIPHKALAALTEYAMQRLTDVQQEVEPTSQESRQVEPVAWITPRQDLHLVNYEGFQDWVPLYTAPPKRDPLTAPQIHELDWPDNVAFEDILEFTRAIERAHDSGGEG